ncbi:MULTISPECIES: extracellular matrix regulator RemB [Bacillus]|uniref:DUF370 domain-containing protein n=1 Tax=Bacillus glycinifermentans TaxID=1664069 RepID=A0AAJ3YVB4_9BACI|nr:MULTISPECIES: extracellular matrix/biofilm biosynthesis regulator RemA family protein [Bacillus]KKB75157.1 hypothetical protein TH62_03425 [Bacillus sp. TH008]MBU8786271.1 DUF370 domain-containing protein [Bacillus glycinifermentans]MDU0070121.1 DUF370 domain-containing protein [Bacillus sp. IG6]MED8017945.1 DUF370 domain-containing protein [Bacillus glycinifermentans]NUJ19223.1 DUF370 domain-containing protein [Bacillus glycinifermentans]
MYIHLGDDFVVSTREIVAIFDYKAKTSPIVEEFLTKQSKRIISSNSTPKSIVVTVQTIYFSPLASSTLKKRAQSKPEIDS